MFGKKTAKIHIIGSVFPLFEPDGRNKSGIDSLGKGEKSVVNAAKIDEIEHGTRHYKECLKIVSVVRGTKIVNESALFFESELSYPEKLSRDNVCGARIVGYLGRVKGCVGKRVRDKLDRAALAELLLNFLCLYRVYSEHSKKNSFVDLKEVRSPF